MSWVAGLLTPPVVADAGYGENGLFPSTLTGRNITYIVQIKPDTGLYPAETVYGFPDYAEQGLVVIGPKVLPAV